MVNEVFHFVFLRKVFIINLIQGVCLCNSDYLGSDCSLRKNVKPSVLDTSYSKNLFDFSNDNLTDALLVVNNFSLDQTNPVVQCEILVN